VRGGQMPDFLVVPIRESVIARAVVH
jgi:hypothetical protein